MALQAKGQDRDREDSRVITANKNLTDSLRSLEQKNAEIQKKLQSAKLFQRAFRLASAMQCKFCSTFFDSNVFIDHIKKCNKDKPSNRPHFFSLPLSVSLGQTMIKEDGDNKPCTEYILEVTFNSNTWKVSRKYKEFCCLFD